MDVFQKSRAGRVIAWGFVLMAVLCLGVKPADAARKRTPVSVAKGTIQVRSAIVMDARTGRVLYEQNADRAIPPASLTKIASMFVALDAVSAGKARLGDTVKVSRQAARQGGSRMFLKRGDRVTLDRLMFGMAVSSGNDASMAVAEKVAGSSAAFVRLMNSKMKALGLNGTTFKNVHGLPAQGQFTTARDMGKLTVAYLRTYPKALRYHSAKAMRHNGVTTTNKNPLLHSYAGADGLKTGWVNASGYNVITTAKRGNLRLVTVVLGAENSNVRAREVRRLMDAGFLAAEKKTTVASVLGLGGKADRLVADSSKQSTKQSVARASSGSKNKQAQVKSTAGVKKQGKSTPARKKNNVQSSSSSKKKEQVRASSGNKKQAQAKPASNSKKRGQAARSKTPSRQATSTKKSGASQDKGWTSSGSLMDS